MRGSRSSAERMRSSRRSRHASRRASGSWMQPDGLTTRCATRCDAPDALAETRRYVSGNSAAARWRHRPRRSSCARCATACRRGLRPALARLRVRARSLSAHECGVPLGLQGAFRRRRCWSITVTASWSKPRSRTHVGADLVMGSLIKNLGGGPSPRRRVRRRAEPTSSNASQPGSTRPGLGPALGPTLGFGRLLSQGLVPRAARSSSSARGPRFRRRAVRRAGLPRWTRSRARAASTSFRRSRSASGERAARVRRGLQNAMPVNARFRPEPGAVPGYADPVVMS